MTVRPWLILLQKSKIESRQKSRESRFLSVSIAEGLLGIDTKVRGRFASNDMVPRVARLGAHQRFLKFLSINPKILLQQNRHFSDLRARADDVSPWEQSGLDRKAPTLPSLTLNGPQCRLWSPSYLTSWSQRGRQEQRRL
jgi:hypothetical protein